MTYNHERYIKKALDSVFSQRTNFKFEIVVGDDFSSDRNLEIIRSYESTDRIHLKILERPEGGDYWKKRKIRGRLYNFQNILENCQGTYVALLDGDDYWTDNTKLQKQVDFLESNPGYSICYHSVSRRNESNAELQADEVNREGKSEFSIYSLAKGNFIETCSCVYKSSGIPKKLFSKSNVGDYALHMHNAQFGRIKHLSDNMAVYRIHDEGEWSKIDNDKKLNRIRINLSVLLKHFLFRNPAVSLIVFKRFLRILIVIGFHRIKGVN